LGDQRKQEEERTLAFLQAELVHPHSPFGEVSATIDGLRRDVRQEEN
jgi:hypothetical protein